MRTEPDAESHQGHPLVVHQVGFGINRGLPTSFSDKSATTAASASPAGTPFLTSAGL